MLRVRAGMTEVRRGRQYEDGPMEPFPGCRPLSAADLEPLAGDDVSRYYEFAAMSDQVTWNRCDCPWWHRLPLVGRFTHSLLP